MNNKKPPNKGGFYYLVNYLLKFKNPNTALIANPINVKIPAIIIGVFAAIPESCVPGNTKKKIPEINNNNAPIKYLKLAGSGTSGTTRPPTKKISARKPRVLNSKIVVSTPKILRLAPKIASNPVTLMSPLKKPSGTRNAGEINSIIIATIPKNNAMKPPYCFNDFVLFTRFFS